MSPVLINHTYPLEMPPERAAQWDQWHASGGWEVERISATIEAIDMNRDPARAGRGRPCVYDIGAERGDLPALWASRGARVVLVEPSFRMWPHIRQVFELNDLAHQVAACFPGFCGASMSSDPHRLTLVLGPWPTCSRDEVIPEPGFQHLDEGGASVITIDNLAEMIDEVPDIITIDCEGSELEVLRGAVGILESVRPTVLVSVHPEFMLDRHDQVPGMLDKYMRDRGYIGHHLASDHEEHWRYLPEEYRGQS